MPREPRSTQEHGDAPSERCLRAAQASPVLQNHPGRHTPSHCRPCRGPVHVTQPSQSSAAPPTCPAKLRGASAVQCKAPVACARRAGGGRGQKDPSPPGPAQEPLDQRFGLNASDHPHPKRKPRRSGTSENQARDLHPAAAHRNMHTVITGPEAQLCRNAQLRHNAQLHAPCKDQLQTRDKHTARIV